MKKIAYLFDSSSGILKDEPDKDIYVVPLNIQYELNNQIKSFAENVDITYDEITDLLKQNKNLKTSLLNPFILKEKVFLLLKEYEEVIYIPISYSLSATYEKVLPLINEINEEYHKQRFSVIKSNAVSYFAYIIMQKIKEEYDGTNLKQIQDLILQDVKDQKYCGILFVNDLQTLIKGGRIKKVKGAIASILNLKLLVLMSETLDFLDKALTFEKQLDKAFNYFNEVAKKNNSAIKEVCFVKGGNESVNEKYETDLKIYEKVKKELNLADEPIFSIARLPGVILCHTGVSCYAMLVRLDS